jgi:UDP-N-acetylglucosamine 2-epimerase (non-hydrolysing)
MSTSILFVAGTRPEIVKLAPVVLLARKRIPDARLLLTGQHRALAHDVMHDFELAADEELDTLLPGATLGGLIARLTEALEAALDRHSPQLVVVQGDTTSALIAGLLAYSRRVPVAHIEAGLRSGDLEHPYPEEANRRMLGVLASMHFAPTRGARDNLRAEGVRADCILVTGNTAVDALRLMRGRLVPPPFPGKLVLATMHRRESWDSGIEEACRAIRRLSQKRPELQFLFPVHHNPLVKERVESILRGLPNVRLLAPLGYRAMQSVLSAAWLALTDSGGIQEEAPSYGVPLLVLRKLTERPEAVERGLARVVGTDAAAIEHAVTELLDDPAAWQAMRARANPFGDGRAAERIVRSLARLLEDGAHRERAALVGSAQRERAA